MLRASVIVLATLVAIFVGVGVLAHTVSAQHRAGPHMPMHPGMTAAHEPSQPGQAAFGAIAEVVRMLDADPTTDWSKVDLERLRQHLIDMNEVVLHSEVKQTQVPGGLAMEITGTGRTQQAIPAMVMPHARELDRLPAYATTVESISGGVRLTVTSKDANDTKTVTRIRGLGFAGLLTEGAHHGPHHLAMAKGETLNHAH